MVLSNPEAGWPAGASSNTHVRVGPDRVLRTYRRDPSVVGKEAALLRLPWQSFVVPAVIEEGADWLVLQYVPHGALRDSAQSGEHVGRALAEIHRRRFERAGFLGADLTVAQPFDDVIDSFSEYARSELERAATRCGVDLRVRLASFLSAHAAAMGSMTRSPVLLHGDFKASNLHWTADARLLVLDWEFAYAGPALMDIGQVLRWDPSPAFVSAFAESYQRHGGELAAGWPRWAQAFDLFNLAGLLGGAPHGSQRAADVRQRIERTLENA